MIAPARRSRATQVASARRPIGEGRAGRRRRQALDVDVVLDRDRHAVERQAGFASPPASALASAQRVGFVAQRDEDRRIVVRADARVAARDGLFRGGRARTMRRDDRRNRVGHDALPARAGISGRASNSAGLRLRSSSRKRGPTFHRPVVMGPRLRGDDDGERRSLATLGIPNFIARFHKNTRRKKRASHHGLVPLQADAQHLGGLALPPVLRRENLDVAMAGVAGRLDHARGSRADR